MGTGLQDNYFTTRVKPHTVTESELDAILNQVNLNTNRFDPTSSDKHTHDGSSGMGPQLTTLSTVTTGDVRAVDSLGKIASKASGDIFYWTTSLQRLAKGTDGMFLRLSGGVPIWTNTFSTWMNFTQSIPLYFGNSTENAIYHDNTFLNWRFDTTNRIIFRNKTTDVATAFMVSGNGTGANSIYFFNTDYIADPTNWEALHINNGYVADVYSIISRSSGTGVIRDILFGTYSGALTEYFRLNTSTQNVMFSRNLESLTTNTVTIGTASKVFQAAYVGQDSGSGTYYGTGQNARIWYETSGTKFRIDVPQYSYIRGIGTTRTLVTITPNTDQTGLGAGLDIAKTDLYTDATNFETLSVWTMGSAGYQGLADALAIISRYGGTGTLRPLVFGTSNNSSITEYFRLDTANSEVLFSKPITLKDNINLYFGTSQEFSIDYNGTNLLINGTTTLLTLSNTAVSLGASYFLPNGSNSKIIGSTSYQFLSAYLGDGTSSDTTSGLFIGQGQENRIWYDTTDSRLRLDLAASVFSRPSSSGGHGWYIIPNGIQTGLNSLIGLYNTDTLADPTNYEVLQIFASGSAGYLGLANSFNLISRVGGTGTIRDIVLGIYDGTTLTEYFRLDATNTRITIAKQLYLNSAYPTIVMNNSFPELQMQNSGTVYGRIGVPSTANNIFTGTVAHELAIGNSGNYPVGIYSNAALVGKFSSSGLVLANGTTINEFSTDGTLGGNSDLAVPTEKAVKTYVTANSSKGLVSFSDFTNWYQNASITLQNAGAVPSSLGSLKWANSYVGTSYPLTGVVIVPPGATQCLISASGNTTGGSVSGKIGYSLNRGSISYSATAQTWTSSTTTSKSFGYITVSGGDVLQIAFQVSSSGDTFYLSGFTLNFS